MQVFETEIVIPLTAHMPLPLKRGKRSPRRQLLFACMESAFGIGFGIFLLLSSSGLKTSHGAPAPGTNVLFALCIVLIVLAILLPLISLLTITLQARSTRSPHQVSINHEGIFTSRDSFLIKWAEIKELSPATFLGSPYLQIVPWDLAEVAERAKVSSGRSLRFGINLTLLLFGHSKSPAPIGLSQRVLPISIDELLTAIQERFASELNEHHIVVRRSQP